MPIEVVNDRLALGRRDPVITGHLRVVLIGLRVALPPVEELPPAIPSQATTRVTASSVQALKSRTKSTT
jgi:hypothetical protein